MISQENKRSLYVFLFSEIFLSIGIGLVNYAQPFLYSSNGLSDNTIGLLFSVNAVVGGLTALLGGSVADRIGTTVVFRFASLMLPLGFLLMGLIQNPDLWILSSALSGFGGALLMSTENVVMKSLASGVETSSVLSKFTSMYTFAMGAGVVVAGFISPHLGYKETLTIGAALALVAPILRLWVKAPDQKSDRMFKLPSKRIGLMSIYACVFSLGVGLFNPFFTLVLHNQFGFHDSWTGIVSSASTFMMAFGALVVSPLQRRLTRAGTLTLAFIGGSALTGCMVFATGGSSFTILYLLRAVVTSVPISIVDAIFLKNSEPTEYAQMFGVRVFGSNIGNAFGSYAGGSFLAHHLLGGLLATSAFTILLAYICLRVILFSLNRGKTQRTQVQADATTFM